MSLEDLESKELEEVEVLRSRLKDQMDPKMYEDISVFQRFLRARNHNINATEKMLKNHMQWRKVNQIDSMVENYVPREVMKYFTMDILGFDKEGAPVWYWEIGNMDARGFWKCVKNEEIIKLIVQLIEKNVQVMNEQSVKLNRKIDKWTHVMNFENYSISTATHKRSLDFAAYLFSTYESNYPERLKAAIVINASIVFSLAFAVVKPFLSGPTAKKISIFSRGEYRDELLKYIDADVLPAFLGGNRTDPDGNPLCNTFIHHGGLVPEEYHIYKTYKSLAGINGVKKLSISRMSKTELPVYISEQGSVIDWEFQSKNGDIGFSVLYKEMKYNTETKELVPKQRIDTSLATETGLLRCEEAGFYVIEFDNAYSWIRRKDVYCKLTITSRNGEEKEIIT